MQKNTNKIYSATNNKSINFKIYITNPDFSVYITRCGVGVQGKISI